MVSGLATVVLTGIRLKARKGRINIEQYEMWSGMLNHHFYQSII